MSTITRSVRRAVQLTLVAAAVAFPGVAATSQITDSASGPEPGSPGREIQRLASEARTADLRGNWDGLVRSHDAVAAVSAPATGAAWIDYYLGYIDWRRSSLAYMAEGMPGVAALLRHAADHLVRALEAVPGFTEARLLLVLVDGASMNAEPSRVAELAPRLRANSQTVMSEAPDNPRVKLLRAFMGFYAPGKTRAEKDAALASWREAADAFPRKPVANGPEWGRAEAWAWLGGTLLVDGKPAEAKVALEQAIAERKDFWWARDIALPQAKHSRAPHASRR